jgi:hypothetical protein
MRRFAVSKFKELALIASAASCLVQAGAQLFAILAVVRTLVAAPPRSFAMLQGEHGYDSSLFWDTVPMVTLVTLLVALVANWKTTRRTLLLLTLALFVIGSILAGVVVEPGFGKLLAVGYKDSVDPAPQAQAATLYAYDWILWLVSLAAGVSLLVALARPAVSR